MNASGYVKEFAVGDKVCVFVPPTAAEAKRRNRKVKHMSWYRGPCTVMEKTGSIYKVRLDAAPRTVYERTLQNVAPWTASGPAPTLGDDGEGAHSALEPVVAAAYAAAAPVKLMTYDVPPPDTSIFALGDMFIAKDDPTLGVWWMHKVVDVTDDAVRTRIYGTWSPQVKSAVFSPLWTDPQDRISTKKIGATWVPWEQTFLTAALPALVLARYFRLIQTPLDKRGKLDAQSRKFLEALPGAACHVALSNKQQMQDALAGLGDV